uniref:Ribosomal protein S10 n=1 Tax=Ophioglossum californicum TaxID=1267209 RepID=A0A1B3TRE6_9MONI|nr:ribosomal protein S10 [Ophioglossum californicum]YP_010439831.1 ribosomal protein S10 [Ophioglossum vulgatum]AOH05884.1 ribosomal protein S10 [Ophioglossum californicum]UTD44877.1 ribosomal protein S10 [Ophioglossum vulgatum]
MTAKICIVMKSFGKPPTRHPHNTRQIGLPNKETLYTVLRSPHIDKKSREQFGMRIHKKLLVIETETQKLREKLLWLKFHHPLGVQSKIPSHYQTSLDFVQPTPPYGL